MSRIIDKYISKETENKIRIYEELLKQWNRRTGLVQEDTIKEFDVRHVLDSLQIIPILYEELKASKINKPPSFNLSEEYPQVIKIPFEEYLVGPRMLDTINERMKDIRIIDIGSGAGIPGMILAICGFANVSLCESNYKKCIFMEEVARQTESDVNIINKNIEAVDETYDLVLSRALTDLQKLLGMMRRISTKTTIGLFHKGQTWKNEVKVASKLWDYKLAAYQSITSINSVVLAVHDLKVKK